MCSVEPLDLSLCGRCIGQEPPRCRRGLRRLLYYWTVKRGDRPFPSRTDIDPLDLPDLLPNLFLVDVLPTLPGADPRFRYRLTGTRVDEIYDQNLTGKTPGDIRTVEIAIQVEQQYRQVLDDRRPRCDHVTLLARDHTFWHYERLILPLSSDGIRIDTLLGGIYLT